MVQYTNLAETTTRCLGYTSQRCWAITQLNVEAAWKEYYTKYDLLEYRLFATGANWYNTIDKIPKDEIPIYAEFFNIYPREFYGVPYYKRSQE
jgi:hypothetical protein